MTGSATDENKRDTPARRYTGSMVRGNYPGTGDDYPRTCRRNARGVPLRPIPVRAALAAAAGVLGALLLVSPAFAHTEIEVDNPQGGATGVTMRVTAEAENDRAGIASVRIVLPAGIAPAQVSLVSGPAGWTLTPGPDGFTVAGSPLAVKTGATFAVKLAQLPPAGGVLVFKSLVTYTDGRVDRWIEEPSTDNPSPKNPAPTVSVRPAAAVPGASVPSASPAGSPSAFVTPVRSAPAQKTGGGTTALIVGAAVLLALLAATALLWRRRRPSA
jgi:hypothetical protein